MDPRGARLFDDPDVVIVGHRGAPREARENTPTAFLAAAAAGATWVELDARLDGEGRVVVHHDPVLADGRPIASLSAAAIAAAGIATLEQVIAELPPGLGMDLEIKNLPGEPDHDEDMAVVAACGDLLRHRRDGRPVVISSFNPMVLVAAAEEVPDLPLALISIQVAMEAALEAALELGCSAVFPHHSTTGLDAARITAAHDAGLQVMVWTVDDPVAAASLVAAGVDALCTNDPRALVAALSPG